MEDTKYKVSFQQKVMWGDMDAFGHVNNTVYLKYFESARVEYFEAVPELAGFKGNEIPVIVNLNCSYKKPVVYPDTLTMNIAVTKLGSASLQMSCDMISAKVGLAAQAACTIVIIDAKKGHSVRMPQVWRDAIEKIEGKEVSK